MNFTIVYEVCAIINVSTELTKTAFSHPTVVFPLCGPHSLFLLSYSIQSNRFNSQLSH